MFEFGSKFTEINVILIELVAVPYNFTNIRMKLSRCSIDFCLQVFLDRLQVHRLFNNFEIVRNIECDGIYGLFEGPRSLVIFKHVENSKAGLHKIINFIIVVLAGSSRIIIEVGHILSVPLGTFDLGDSLGWLLNIHGIGINLFLEGASFLFIVGPFVLDFALYL